jgi:amino acid transporter
MLVIVFALLAVIMMGISMVLPWYTITTEVGGKKVMELSSSFSGLTADDGNETESKGWGEKPIDELYDNQAGVFTIAMIMTILGLVFAILLLIGAVMAKKGKGKKLAVIFGLLAFLFCLLAPILLMAMHPGAVAQDYKDNYKTDPEGKGPHDSFFGSEEAFGFKISWGGGVGWIMAMIGFIFALLGFILALKLPKPAYSSPAPLPPPGPSYDQPPPVQQYPNYGQPPQYPQQQQQPPPQYPQY